MYRKIMVPLDGSKLAECVLPHVEALLEGAQVQEVVFVWVVEPFEVPPLGEGYTIDEQKVNWELRRAAEEYLKGLVCRVM